MEKEIQQFEDYLQDLLLALSVEENIKKEIYLEIKESLYASYKHHLIMGCGIEEGVHRTINGFEEPKRLAGMFNKAYQEDLKLRIRKYLLKRLTFKLDTARIAMVLAVLSFLTFTGTFSYAFSGTPIHPRPLPQEIKNFYVDYNFVYSFSTPTERLKLLKDPIVNKSPRSERLRKVHNIIKDLQRKNIFDYNAFFTEYIFVNGHRKIGNEIEVYVGSIPIGARDNKRFISEYKNPSKSISSFEKGQRTLYNYGIDEKHTWKIINGVWIKVDSQIQ